MLVDHCVIGGGLSALGAILGFSDRGVQNFCLIEDERDKLEHYFPFQILRYLGLGGTSRFWHGVIPTRLDQPDRQKLFERFFDHDPSVWKSDNLFIPKSPIRSAQKLKSVLSNNKRVSGVVKQISLLNDIFEVTLESGERLLARKVWCAAGVIGTLGILHRSGWCPGSVLVGDHICGFSSLISARRASALVKRSVCVSHGLHGYSVPCRYSLDNKTLFTLRPARLEMRDPIRQQRGGPKFAIGRAQMIWDLIKSRSLGRLSEAVALKTGVGFLAPMYAVHFQHEYLACHRCNVVDEKLHSIYDPKDVTSRVNVVSTELELGFVPEQTFYYGTHLFGAQGVPDLPQGLHVVDSTLMPSIGGGHHSFSQLVRAYWAVQNALENDG